MNDIDEWHRPEDMGLRREDPEPVRVAVRSGLVGLLLGAAIWALGQLNWSGDLAFLEAFDSRQGRLLAALCALGGVGGLLLSRAAFWNRL